MKGKTMSEAERRKGYPTRRILVEAARILTPTFDDADLFFTGAQIELMRNLLGYARREETFVETYGPGYYLVPDASDFDDIQAIVADLEETLMGNRNVLWGYFDQYTQPIDSDRSAVEYVLLYGTNVAAGFVHVIQSITAYYTTGTCDFIELFLATSDGVAKLERVASPVIDIPVVVARNIVIDAGGHIRAGFNVTAQPCHIYFEVVGYKMVVP